MANFVGNFTKVGLEILSGAMSEKKLKITRAMIGQGNLPEGKTAYDMTDLMERLDIPVYITGHKDLGEGKTAIMLRVKNANEDFVCREIGIIAEDEKGNEVLYQYANAGEKANTIWADENSPFYYDIAFITVIGADNNLSVNVDLQIEITREEFEEHSNNTNNPHHVTKGQVGLGNVTNEKQATSQEFNDLVSKLNSGGVINSTRNVNQLYTLHDFTGNYLYKKVQEAYFLHTITEEEKTDKYVSFYTILSEIGYTSQMDYNKIAVLSFSACVGEGDTMCVIDSYGQCYVQDGEAHFDSNRAEIMYGTIRIVRFSV